MQKSKDTLYIRKEFDEGGYRESVYSSNIKTGCDCDKGDVRCKDEDGEEFDYDTILNPECFKYDGCFCDEIPPNCTSEPTEPIDTTVIDTTIEDTTSTDSLSLSINMTYLSSEVDPIEPMARFLAFNIEPSIPEEYRQIRFVGKIETNIDTVDINGFDIVWSYEQINGQDTGPVWTDDTTKSGDSTYLIFEFQKDSPYGYKLCYKITAECQLVDTQEVEIIQSNEDSCVQASINDPSVPVKSYEECSEGIKLNLSSDVDTIWWFSGSIPSDSLNSQIPIPLSATVTCSTNSMVIPQWSVDAIGYDSNTCAKLTQISTYQVKVEAEPGVGDYQVATVKCEISDNIRVKEIFIKRPWYCNEVAFDILEIQMFDTTLNDTVLAYQSIYAYNISDNFNNKIEINQLPFNEYFDNDSVIWTNTDWSINNPFYARIYSPSFEFIDIFGFYPALFSPFGLRPNVNPLFIDTINGGPTYNNPKPVSPNDPNNNQYIISSDQYYYCGSNTIGSGSLIGKFRLRYYRGVAFQFR